MVWWLVGAVMVLAVSVGRTWWRERAVTEQVRDAEWARTLAVAAEHGWPPYTVLPGLSRGAELAWRESYLRIAPHCRLLAGRDGRAEWVYVQPGEAHRG